MEHLWAKYALIPAWEDLMNSGCSSSWSKAFTMDRNQPRLILPKEIEHMIPLILSTIWSTDKLPSYHYYKCLNFNYELTRITLDEWEQNWFTKKTVKNQQLWIIGCKRRDREGVFLLKLNSSGQKERKCKLRLLVTIEHALDVTSSHRTMAKLNTSAFWLYGWWFMT